MDFRLPVSDLQKPEELQKLISSLSELAEQLDVMYTTTAPNGNISARQGKIALYYDGSNYQRWQNVDGATTWERIASQGDVVLLTGDQTVAGDKEFTGTTTLATVDINGGAIDGANIGATTPGTGAFSTLKVGTTNQGDVLYDNGTSIVRLTPGTSGKFLKTQGAAANPIWDSVPESLSNVLFSFAGCEVTGTKGFILDTILNHDMTADDGNYAYWGVDGSTYATIIPVFKWKKIAGINTVSIHARIWVESSGVRQANLKVDIGGQNNNVNGTQGQQTPEYVTFDIDVSGLTNGTLYDVTIQLKEVNNAASAYLSSIIAIGS